MEVVDACETLLTNAEVFQLAGELDSYLNKRNAGKKKIRPTSKTVTSLLKEVRNFLATTPSSVQTEEQIQDVIRKLKPFDLLAAELMMIINLRPENAVELQLLVEESEERLTPEQMDEIVEIVTSAFRPRPTAEELKKAAA